MLIRLSGLIRQELMLHFKYSKSYETYYIYNG